MGTFASYENPGSNSGSRPGEDGVRGAILAAARKVAERDGVPGLTLTAVAKEARVAANDIYGFFTSKNDLLQAVVADDLAGLAKQMRRTLDPHPNGAAAALPPLVMDESAPETDGPAPMKGTQRRFPVVQARRSQQGATAPDTATTDEIARLQERVAKLESSPVDQWLERRLREFERTLYGLQHNQNRPASGTSGFEERLKELRKSVEALEARHAATADVAAQAANDRLSSFDRRLREALSELQAESAHLARRTTALENLAFASRPELMPPSVADFETAAEKPPPVAPEQPPIVAAGDDAPQTGDEPLPSYLAAARRSAQVAAASAEDEETDSTVRREPKKTMFYALCGALAVLLLTLAFVAYLFRHAIVHRLSDVSAAPATVHAVRAAPAKQLRQLAAASPAPHVAQNDAPRTNLLKLAETGDASAELLVGLDYLEGRGVPKNEASAVEWLSRAAAKGQPVAEYDLGALYADGRGVRADPVQAFQWFGAAALHGNRRAMHFLAIAYADGVGTTKDLSEAVRWFERAAMLGAVNSQFNVAVLYERGMGVPQSLVTAYKWYAIAGSQGDKEAEARVSALASTMKPDDLANAKRAVESFRPEPLDPAANLPPKLPS